MTNWNNHLDLTAEELNNLTQGESEFMSQPNATSVNLKGLSDDDLGQLLGRIRDEQERRKWQRVQEVLDKYLFPLSTVDLLKVQNLIHQEVQKREASSDPLRAADGFSPEKNAKDSLTGQFGADWKKRSGTPEDPSTIDVQVSP